MPIAWETAIRSIRKSAANMSVFKTDNIAAQSNYTEHEEEDLREVDIDWGRHEGENQDRAEGEKA